MLAPPVAPHLVGCLLDVVAALAVEQGLVDGDLQWLPAAGLEEGLLLAVDDRAGQGVAGCATELGCRGREARGRRSGQQNRTVERQCGADNTSLEESKP